MLSGGFFIWIQRKRFPIFCFTWKLAWLCWSNKGPFGSRPIQTFAWSSKGTRIPSSLDCSSDWGPTSTQPSICNVKQIFWIVHEILWSSLQTSGRIRLRSSYEDLSRIFCIKMHHYLYLESLLGQCMRWSKWSISPSNMQNFGTIKLSGWPYYTMCGAKGDDSMLLSIQESNPKQCLSKKITLECHML